MIAGLSSCPECRAETSPEDKFCQECGVEQSQPRPSRFLHYEEDDDDAELVSRPLERLLPSAAKSVVALPVIALVVVVLSASVWAAFGGIEKVYKSLSRGYITEQAKKALAANRTQEAITILQHIQLERNAALDLEQRELLDRALFLRGQDFAAAQRYDQAVSDLSSVSPAFSQRDLALAKLTEYKVLLDAQMNKVSRAVLRVKAASRNRVAAVDLSERTQSSRVRSIASNDAIAAPPQRDSSSKQAGDASTTVDNAPSPTEQKQGASTAVQPVKEAAAKQVRSKPESQTTAAAPYREPAFSDSAPATVSESKVATSEPIRKPSAAASPQVKYAESDVVRYNELLAGYFTESATKKAGKTPAGKTTEPPSLKEWIEMGKPRF